MVKPNKDHWKSKKIAPSTSHNGRICSATKNTFLNYVFEKEYFRQSKEWQDNIDYLRQKHLNKPVSKPQYLSMSFTRTGIGRSMSRPSVRQQNYNNSNTSLFPQRKDGVGRMLNNNNNNTISSPSISSMQQQQQEQYQLFGSTTSSNNMNDFTLYGSSVKGSSNNNNNNTGGMNQSSRSRKGKQRRPQTAHVLSSSRSNKSSQEKKKILL